MTAQWLQDRADPAGFFRPLDYFAIVVVQDRRLAPEQRVAAARAYSGRWGMPALAAALAEAAEVEALPVELAAVASRIDAASRAA